MSHSLQGSEVDRGAALRFQKRALCVCWRLLSSTSRNKNNASGNGGCKKTKRGYVRVMNLKEVANWSRKS